MKELGYYNGRIGELSEMTVPMTDIVIGHTELGQPVATLTGKAAEMGGTVMISITHEGGMAAAMAVWMA